jgi:ABC-type Fe3+/spermidine/putrescine transport system ATPase subunit
MALADRIAVMRDGVVAQIGPPPALYKRPDNVFVAEFLGHVNWVPGTVSGPDTVASAVGPVRCPVPPGFAPGDPVVLGVRQEAVAVGVTFGDRENVFAGEVTSRMFLGDASVIALDVAGVRILAKTPGEIGDVGEVEVRIPPPLWMVFAPDRSGATDATIVPQAALAARSASPIE